MGFLSGLFGSITSLWITAKGVETVTHGLDTSDGCGEEGGEE